MIEKNGHYYERCGDCGDAVIDRKMSTRKNVCDECWERRLWLVKHPELWGDRFQKIQTSMAHHTGKAKQQIIEWQRDIEEKEQEDDD